PFSTTKGTTAPHRPQRTGRSVRSEPQVKQRVPVKIMPRPPRAPPGPPPLPRGYARRPPTPASAARTARKATPSPPRCMSHPAARERRADRTGRSPSTPVEDGHDDRGEEGHEERATERPGPRQHGRGGSHDEEHAGDVDGEA